MTNMQIIFSCANIGRGHVIFLNKDISITVRDVTMKLYMTILHVHYEGNMSQILYLGLGFCSM